MWALQNAHTTTRLAEKYCRYVGDSLRRRTIHDKFIMLAHRRKEEGNCNMTIDLLSFMADCRKLKQRLLIEGSLDVGGSRKIHQLEHSHFASIQSSNLNGVERCIRSQP